MNDGRAAQNQAPRFDNRTHVLRSRLKATSSDPSGARMDALTSDLHRQKSEAYRNALIREGKTWGVHDAHGPLDPFMQGHLYHESQVSAQRIMSTYQKRRLAAQARGEDMKAWEKNWWDFKAPQVLQWEYGQSDYHAVRDFYSHNLSTLLQTKDAYPVAHVEPRDAKVPDMCQVLIDRGYMSVDEAMTYSLPWHQNCFIAGTIVTGPSVEVGFSRPYEGPIVTIRTASGNELTGTPNHPILTPEGWIALGLLNEGDHLFSSSNSELVACISDPDKYQVPALIEEVCTAGSMLFRAMPTSATDFHGDGMADGNVNVVLKNSFFKNDRSLCAFCNHLSQTVLCQRGVRGSLLSRMCSLFFDRLRVANPSPCSLRLMDRIGNSPRFDADGNQPLMQRSLCDTKFLRKTRNWLSRHIPINRLLRNDNTRLHTTNVNASLAEQYRQTAMCDASLLRKFTGGLPALVASDQIVEVVRGFGSHQVYNSSTSQGWYLANNIIVANCPHYWVVENNPDVDLSSSELNEFTMPSDDSPVESFTSDGKPPEPTNTSQRPPQAADPYDMYLPDVDIAELAKETGKTEEECLADYLWDKFREQLFEQGEAGAEQQYEQTQLQANEEIETTEANVFEQIGLPGFKNIIGYEKHILSFVEPFAHPKELEDYEKSLSPKAVAKRLWVGGMTPLVKSEKEEQTWEYQDANDVVSTDEDNQTDRRIAYDDSFEYADNTERNPWTREMGQPL